MSVTLTRDDAAELLDTLRGAIAAIDAGEPVDKAMLEPAVALAEQFLEAADGPDRPTGPGAMAVAVAEFHEHRNSTGRAATVALTPWLHAEEHDELLEAIARDDPAAIARELADVAYLAFSEAWARGLDLDAALVEVHRAALDKIAAGGRDAAGKLVKPPGFRPPDVTAATARAAADGAGHREAAASARALRRTPTTTGRSTTMSQSACTHSYDPHTGACQTCGVELMIVPMTFDGLLHVAERILTAHYPADIFPTPTGDTRDPGVR